MKHTLSLVSIGLLAVAIGCASTPPPTLQTGPAAEVTIDGLTRVDNSRMTFAYVKPDMELQRYTKFIIDPVEVSYQKDPQGRTRTSMLRADDNFALTASQMELLKSLFREEVVKALTGNDGYQIVTEPGPDVLRVEASLIDLVVKVPTEGRGGRQNMFVRSYGLVTLILEVRDSQSGEILARTGERADPTRNTSGGSFAEVSPVFIRSDVTRLFRHWAQLMREGFDTLRAMPATN